MVDELGRAWTTDGTRPVERLHIPEGTALDIAFADMRRGAVVLDGGALWRTDDAGATWTQADLGPDAAISLERRIDSAHPADYILMVKTTGGMLNVYRTSVTTASDVRVAKLDTGSLLGRLWIGARQAARIRLGDDAGYAIDGSEIVRLDYETRKELARSKPLDGKSCRLLGWGTRVIATCAQPSQRAWSFDASLEFMPLELGSDVDPVDIRWSDDAVHAVAYGACQGDKPVIPRDRQAVCARGADGWHTKVVESVFLRLVHGALALTEPDGLLDLDAGTFTKVLIEKVVNDGERHDLQWTGNGNLVATVGEVARHGFNAVVARHWLVRGPVGGPFAKSLLPAEVDRVSFADDRRGMVAGKTLDTIWRTLDGGATWEHVIPPLDGDPRRITHDLGGAFWRRFEGLQCSDRGCCVGGALVVEGWGALEPGTAPALLARRPPVVPAPPRFAAYTPRNAQSCTLALASASTTPPGAVATASVTTTTTIFGPQGSATLELTSHGVDAAITLAWKDDRGAAHRSGPSLLPGFGADAVVGAKARYLLRASTTAGALVERCASSSYEPCNYLWARAGDQVTPIAALRTGPVRRALWTDTVVPRVNGGVAALLYTSYDRHWFDAVVLVAPTGKAQLRWFVWGTPPHHVPGEDRVQRRALARYRGQLGYVFADAIDPSWLRFVALDAGLDARPLNLPWVIEQVTGNATCKTAPRSELELYTATELESDKFEVFATVLTRGRLTPIGLCIEDARSWAHGEPFESIEVPSAQVRATVKDGALVTTSGTAVITCAP